jgi:hypothetical protein
MINVTYYHLPFVVDVVGEGVKAKIGEGCPKVRLSQDRLPI